jgi:DNA repair protein SbcC/Rad50
MRPLRLTLQGFTSFADRAEIDFTDMDLFAITGRTGAGKTSILDAMTWALYGKTPRLGRCGIELISHGKNSVAVHFEFLAGTNHYRITRSTRRSGAPQVRLEKLSSGEWVPEEAVGITEINAAIAKIVGLDFDAFKLAVILPQGQFDSFLRGDHAERRKILKSLLGLEVYDRMREMAHDTYRDLTGKIEGLDQLLTREYADATEDRLKVLKVELREQKKAGREEEARLDEAHKICTLADEIEQNQSARARKEREHSETDREYLAARDEADKRADKANCLRRTLEGIRKQHDEIVIDDRRSSELVKLRTRADELDRLVNKRQDAQTSLANAQKSLQTTISEQAHAHKCLRSAEDAHGFAQETRAESQRVVDELGPDALLRRLLEELQTLPTKLREAQSLRKKALEAVRKQDDLEKLLAELLPQVGVTETGLARAREREEELTRHDAHRELRAGLKKGKPCPVCEQTVSVLPQIPAVGELDSARKDVRSWEKKLQEIRDKVTSTHIELANLPGALEQFESQRSRVESEIADIRKRVHAVAEDSTDDACSQAISSKVKAIRQAGAALKLAAEKEIEAAKTWRDAGTRAAKVDANVAEIGANVAAVESELSGLIADIEQIQPEIAQAGGRTRIVSELEAIEKARKLKSQLAAQFRPNESELREAERKSVDADRNAAVLKERVRSLKETIGTLMTLVTTLETQWAELAANREFPDGNSGSQRAARWRDAVQKTYTGIQQHIAELKTNITAMQGKIEGRLGVEKRVQEIRSEQDLYDQIRNALRADRFIDHLLGRAYDDLCHRGSEHLLRVSSERYSFAAGKNTFNVKDGWNGDAERPAGTLSGGESFFASLALALALAESVSSFSADGSQTARLEALFLDEGVSTLDQDEALPAVVDALIALQDGDRMIGVISHMDDLAQRLPLRIEVVKNHGRSTVRMEDSANEMYLPTGAIEANAQP